MSDPLQIVVGYDRNQVAAYHTLCESILRGSSRPVSITPLYLPQLEADGLMWRKDRGSTDFAFSRFLAPYLVGYHGRVLFLDCDIVLAPGADVAELFNGHAANGYCVAVCKHDYAPAAATKFRGNAQSAYPCKLWSAVMLFNCSSQRVKNLTPRYVNEAEGWELHQFEWTHPARIEALPEEWHWIPGHSSARLPLSEAKLIHFTEGGPWFLDYGHVEGAAVWTEAYNRMREIEA